MMSKPIATFEVFIKQASSLWLPEIELKTFSDFVSISIEQENALFELLTIALKSGYDLSKASEVIKQTSLENKELLSLQLSNNLLIAHRLKHKGVVEIHIPSQIERAFSFSIERIIEINEKRESNNNLN